MKISSCQKAARKKWHAALGAFRKAKTHTERCRREERRAWAALVRIASRSLHKIDVDELSMKRVGLVPPAPARKPRCGCPEISPRCRRIVWSGCRAGKHCRRCCPIADGKRCRK